MTTNEESSSLIDPQEPQTPAPNPPSGMRSPLLAGAAYLVLLQVALRIPADGIATVVISTLLSVGVLIWFSSALASGLTTRRAVLLNLTVSLVMIVPWTLRLLVAFHALPTSWLVPLVTAFHAVRLPWVLMAKVAGLPELMLIWFACSVGGAVARLLRGANMIPPVAAVLALVDIWTVLMGGPVSKIMKSSAPAAQAATHAFTVPLPTSSRGAMPMVAIGFADFLFIAFFVAALCRFVPLTGTYRRSVIALIAVLCPYMALVMFSDSIPFMASWPGLPALLPIAIVMIAVHWRQFHYDRSEAFALLYAACFIAAIVGAFWFFARKPEAKQESSVPDIAGREQLVPLKGADRRVSIWRKG